MTHYAKISILILMYSLAADAHIAPHEIGDAYISSFGSVKKDKIQVFKIDANGNKQPDLALRHMDTQELRSRAFDIINAGNTITTNLEYKQLMQDLAVFHGQQGSENIHLAGILNHCTTVFGEVALTAMLAGNIGDQNTVFARQALIKELVENTELYAKLKAQMIAIKDQSDAIFSIYAEHDAFKELLDKVYFTSNALNSINKNSHAMEVSVRLQNALTALAIFSMPICYVLLEKYSDMGIFDAEQIVHAVKNRTTKYGNKSLIFALGLAINNLYNINKYKSDYALLTKTGFDKDGSVAILGLRAGYAAVLPVFTAIYSYSGLKLASQNKNTINYLQAGLIGVATLINNAKETLNLTQHNQILSDGLALKDEFIKFFAVHDNKELDELIALLQTNTFKDQASFFSLSGRVLAAYKLMETHKQEFARIMLALGELDACLAMADVVRESHNNRVGYCFVEFQDSKTPYIKLDNFWNPFVNTDVVITNSIELGGSQPRAIILTGSNTGGKSTNLKAIMISVLLGRTFGIAPAQCAVMTPFSYMGTSMNVIDNTVHGDSLFQAEVKRAQGIVSSVMSLVGKEFGILVVDELFTGTGVEKGTAAAKKVAEHLAKSPNIILILATHFPELTKLESETNGLFKNYKVDVYKDENGNLVRPFKLEQGVSTNNIADDILQERLDFLTAQA